VTAHAPSDDTAILAAQARLVEIARNRFDAVAEAFRQRPTSHVHLDAIRRAAEALHERAASALGAPPAAEEPTGGVIVHAVPPGLHEALTAEERVYTANGPWVAEESKP
jgi:hypothetical protein